MGVFEQVVKVIASVTSATASTLSYVFAPEKDKIVSLQGVVSAGTVAFTVLGTLDPDRSSSNYVDITNQVFNTSSVTGSFLWIDPNGNLSGCSWCKLQAVITSTVPATYVVYCKRS